MNEVRRAWAFRRPPRRTTFSSTALAMSSRSRLSANRYRRPGQHQDPLAPYSESFSSRRFRHPDVCPRYSSTGNYRNEQLQKRIRYSFQETPMGGRVMLSSSDPAALVAIHKFLRFQIAERQSGDATAVP